MHYHWLYLFTQTAFVVVVDKVYGLAIMCLLEDKANERADVLAVVELKECGHVGEDDLEFGLIVIGLNFDSDPAFRVWVFHEKIVSKVEVALVADEFERGGKLAMGDFVGDDFVNRH